MQGPSLARQCSRDNAGPHAGSRHRHLQFLLLITVTYFAFIYTFILWWRLNKDFQQFLSLQYEYFIPLFMIFRACLDNCIETILCLPGAWPSLLLVPVFPCLITDTGRWSGLFNLLLLQNTMVRVVTTSPSTIHTDGYIYPATRPMDQEKVFISFVLRRTAPDNMCSEGGARRRELLDKAISDQIRDY